MPLRIFDRIFPDGHHKDISADLALYHLGCSSGIALFEIANAPVPVILTILA